MAVFRRLLYAALCAGLLSGIFVAAAHQIGTVPLILQAETYEEAAQQASAQTHAHGNTAAAVHEGAEAGWKPETRVERAAYTLAADLLAAIGFALLLAAGLTLRGGAVTWRDGLFWGLAGFVTFTLAPGLGLPPEIPGAEAAPLVARQFWWLATTVATGCGLALLVFTTRPRYAILAVALIALPHSYGAPSPAEHAAGAAPEALAHRFAVAATLASFLFWAALGASTGYFYRRFAPSAG
jgi:cobalt transporter subunit CbtA